MGSPNSPFRSGTPPFLRLWCAKEAVLKAHGRGLAFGLDRLAFDRLDGVPRLAHVDAGLGRVDDWHLAPLDLGALTGMVAWRARTRPAP